MSREGYVVFILFRDLSSTAITSLPTRGLEYLEHLILRDTHLLKVFPAAFHFKVGDP